MKKLIATCIALTLGLAISIAQAGVVVTFSPAAQHVDVGNAVQVEVRISGLGAEVLSGFDLNFFYDAAILQFQSVDTKGAADGLNASSGFAPQIAVDSTTNGNMGIQGYATADDAALSAGQADAFTLFRFDLIGVTDGMTSFTLGSDPDYERNFVGLDFQTLPDVTVLGACVAVGNGTCGAAQLPEPGTAGLALAALAMGLVHRRRGRFTA
ncbi:cohesin domain-containing protein [Roseateles sp. BYS78W]|uniref:Cohesin domain-containing protein n=1 Tax=Pelomonas candidula TaxID=3299025 RepID=A0ABW7HC48_9BURK